MTDDALSTMAATVRRRLGVRITGTTPAITGAVVAGAELTGDSRTFYGWGVGDEAEEAADLATMECVERWALIQSANLPVVRGSYRDLVPAAVNPHDLGLHNEMQYTRAGSRMDPFNPDQPRSWTTVRRWPDGQERLVPLELVHPAARIAEAPLAADTSSGTAAHSNRQAAVVMAVCEAVERDAALLWWHRRTRAPVVSDLAGSAAAAAERLRAAGHVLVVCRLDQDVTVPTFLAIALRGRRAALGLGTRERRQTALDHAMSELAGNVTRTTTRRAVHLPVGMVKTTEDHRALYDDGPLHEALRSALEETLDVGAHEPPAGSGALAALGDKGLQALVCEVAPPVLTECGVVVVRVLVPGLAPYYVGGEGLRLGTARLAGADSPGHLRTLLPHPFG